jgi:putative polyhydroxyalkanoate system protein
MPRFEVDIPHQLPPDEVRTRLDRATAKLEKDYGAACRWEGDGANQHLVVSRKGLNAKVAVEPSRLHVDVELGLLLSPMAGSIRNGITKQLTELLAATSGP